MNISRLYPKPYIFCSILLKDDELCGFLIDVTFISVLICRSGKSIPFALEPIVTSYLFLRYSSNLCSIYVPTALPSVTPINSSWVILLSCLQNSMASFISLLIVNLMVNSPVLVMKISSNVVGNIIIFILCALFYFLY